MTPVFSAGPFWKLLRGCCWTDCGAVALLGAVVAFWVSRVTGEGKAALQTPCRDFSTCVGNRGSRKGTALLHSLRQVFTTLTSREDGGGNWVPAGSWATASGVPVTRIYCAYRCIHLPQLLASPSIWHGCILWIKWLLHRGQNSTRREQCVVCFGDFPPQ